MVPLRDVPRGVAQERIEKHTAYDIVSYAYYIMYYDVMKYLCCTCGSMHVIHSSRDPQTYRSQGPITNATRKPQ